MKNVKKVSMDLSVLDEEMQSCSDDMEHQFSFDLPEEQGNLEAVFLYMSQDVAVYSGDHHYNQDATGPEYAFGNVNGVFETDTFMASTVVGGWTRQVENFPKCDVSFGDQLTLFRNARKYDFDSTVQASKHLRYASMMIPISSMKLLIGEESTDKFMHFLEIEKDPSIAIHRIPLRITQILQSAINPRLTGSMKQLYCQAKAFEYLCELVELMEKKEQGAALMEEKQSLIFDIHEDLIKHVGRLPSLAELAQQYGLPARTLNTLFLNEYGLSIHQYISRVRLEKAHEIIKDSDIALKVIAAKLGYSHVNHFITAFKREFGYPPGTLRK